MFNNKFFKIGFFSFLVIFVIFWVVEKGDKVSVVVESNSYMETVQSITSDKYFFSDNYITNILPKTLKDGFLADFKVSGGELSLKCDNNTNYVGSSCQVYVLSDELGNLNYDLVVHGDVNGDGDSNLTDIVNIAIYSKDKISLNKDIYVMAGDIDGNDATNLDDASLLSNYIILKKELPSDLGKQMSVEIPTKKVKLNKNESFEVDVKYNQEGVSIINWTSSNLDVVKVDSLGVITAVGGGNAVVVANISNGNIEYVEIDVEVVVPATGITFSKSSLDLEKGNSTNLIATVSPSDVTDKSVTFKSGDTSVVTVDNKGVVNAVGVGSTIITATTSNGISTSIPVTVTIEVADIGLNNSNIELSKGDNFELVATVSPSDATDKSVIFKSDDDSVVTVDKNGLIKAVGAGNTYVTVTASNGVFVKVYVEVIVPTTGISLNENNVELVKGESFNLVATVSPSDATDKSVTFKSGDTSVVTVDKNGVIKAVGAGSTYITVSASNDVFDEVYVSVTVVATDVSLNENKIEMDKGESFKLVATVSPSDATDKSVVWSSSDTSVLKVDSNGNVTAIGNGTAIVTATLKSNSSIKDTCQVDVSTVYSSLTSLGVISLGSSQLKVERTSKAWVAQGFCVAGNYYVTALRNSSDTYVLIRVYNKNTGSLLNEFSGAFGHANGMTFDGNYVYIVYNGSSDVVDNVVGSQTNLYYKFSSGDLLNSSPNLIKGGFYNSSNSSYISISGAHYDGSNGLYYLGKGSNVRVYDAKSQKIIRTIAKKDTDTPQDVGGYNGKILVIRYNGSGDSTGKNVDNAKNAIDIYRASDGAYLGTYTIASTAELESIDYYGKGNEFALYFYNSGNGGAIYKVNLDI